VTERFDVVIVGARCAGASLATLLARGGLRACLFDKAAFPSDTLSTHGIQPHGVKVLETLGVLDHLVTLAPPIDGGTITFDDLQIEVEGLTEKVGAPFLCVRRVTLDPILVDAAAAAGAEIRTRTAVTGLIEEHGRVVGVRTDAGETRAALTVGADGSKSTVGELVGARRYDVTDSRRVFAWAYFEGVDRDPRVWLGAKGDRGFIAAPTDDDLFMAAIAPAASYAPELRADRQGAFLRTLQTWPELHAKVAEGGLVGPVRTAWKWQGYLRESAGPGWVLVGDAGHFKDPSPGQGIGDALRQSETLAAAILTALGAAPDPDRVLRDWWAWRDRDAWEMYWFAYDMGAPEPPGPVLDEIQRRIATTPELVRGMMGVLSHTAMPSEVFKPGLLLRAAGTALRRRRGRRAEVFRELAGVLSQRARRGRGSRISP
jgi:2-polyprenyl-6-methoxyphenol hydroxylase-like FAD-dependent oxidoreductase